MSLTQPYELCIGVTGHRTLGDPAGVERAVEALLQELQRVLDSGCEHPRGVTGVVPTILDRLLMPLTWALSKVWRDVPTAPAHTPSERRTPIEWTVISPLARGADRIVARAVLRRPGSRLQVVMPFAADDYRQDFVDAADRAEFEGLLRLDATPVELHAQPGKGQDARNAGYLRVGHRVVDACEMLIAVWDGERADGRGGTADIVAYALDQGRLVLWIDAAAPANPVRVLTKDGDGDLPTTAMGARHRPLYGTVKELSLGFHQQAAYNRTPAIVEREARARAEELDRLRSAATESDFPREALDRWTDHFLPHYLRADQLAVGFQALYARTAVLLYVLSAFAVTIATVQVLLLPHALWVIAFEVLAMLAVLALLGISKKEAWHAKWLDDRHLAERVRVAMFRALVDVERTAQGPHVGLPFYQGPGGWMAALADRLVRTYPRADGQPVSIEALRSFVVRAWIGDQASWHAKNADRKRTAAKQGHRAGQVLFLGTLAMATLHLAGVGHHGFSGAWLGAVISMLAIVLPAWGTAVHAVGILRDRERIAERSKRMHAILSSIAERAGQATTVDELRAAVAQAAAVMEIENHEWAVSLSYRDLVLPA